MTGGGGEGRGLRFFRFAGSRIDGSFESARGGGTSVWRIWSQECTARSFSMSALGLSALGLCARARALGGYTYTRVGIATNPHTPGIIVLPLSERVFFTANERVFGALITSAFYIIHGMEEDRG